MSLHVHDTDHRYYYHTCMYRMSHNQVKINPACYLLNYIIIYDKINIHVIKYIIRTHGGCMGVVFIQASKNANKVLLLLAHSHIFNKRHDGCVHTTYTSCTMPLEMLCVGVTLWSKGPT